MSISNEQFSALNIEHFAERPLGMPMVPELNRRKHSAERTSIGTDTPLFTTQRTFDPRTIEKYRANPAHSPVAVWEDQGDHFIVDGHHRAIAARQEGRDISATVYRTR